MLCHLAHVLIKSESRENSSGDKKKDRLEYVKFHWKGSRIYRCSNSTSQKILCRQTIFEDFEPPFKKFLATSLDCLSSLEGLFPSEATIDRCSTK